MNLNILLTFAVHQFFPDDKLKNYILTEHNQAVYNISHLGFEIMDQTINASDYRYMFNLAILDDTRTST